MKKKKISILGAGLVGSVIAEDLASSAEFEVVSYDNINKRLNEVSHKTNGNVKGVQIDLSNSETVSQIALDSDLVVGALPSNLGFFAAKSVIASRCPYVDISFASEDLSELNTLAKEADIPVIVDFGVAPGMSNLLSGLGASYLDEPKSLEIVDGGLPVERLFPWEYKAGFSPFDVIEEYVRPARLVIDNKLVVKEALSEVELIDLPRVGTVEAFNSDGLRSLLDTLKIPNMRERTLRWPGHAEKMSYLRYLGLFSLEPIEVSGVKVIPRDFVAKLLFPQWKYDLNEKDFTVMKVEIEGISKGELVSHKWYLTDYACQKTGHSSMARTTGFPCAAMVRLILKGHKIESGVHFPESLSFDETLVDFIFSEQNKRGIVYKYEKETLGPQGY